MLFKFLKYLQPTNYFGLKKKNGHTVFPIIDELPKDILELIAIDNTYKSNFSVSYDASWQALQKGYIGNVECYSNIQSLPIEDEYKFIKKYFNPIWSLYVLLIRLLTFHNPYVEIKSFIKAIKVKRSNLYDRVVQYDQVENHTDLINQAPLVSVIIPTLNRYKYLKDVLRDLENQTYKNFEVIIVDQSDDFQNDFYSNWDLNLTYWNQKEKALWKARNEAIKISKGEYILLYDDDSLVNKDWITYHLKVIGHFMADISSGVSLSSVGDKIPLNYNFLRISDQLDTGNVMLKRQVFKSIGLFDRQYEKQRMGDGEYGLRSYINNYINISNPYAKRIHLKVGTGGLRQMGSWDGFRPKKIFSARPVPSVLYQFRKYYGNKLAFFSILKFVPPSIIPYKFKGNRFLLLIGVVISILLFPLVVFQILKSWRLSTIKLNQGPYIDSLEK